MAEPRIDENGLPVYAPGDYDFVRVVDRSTGASRNALAPEVTAAARALSGALAQVVADAQADIAPVIAGLGYLPPVPFASGLTVDSSRITVSHGGEVYAPVADALPFTTTGTFNPAQWRVIQGIVGADLLSDTGASIVAMKQAGATTYQRTVAAELLDRVSILRFIPPALHAGIRNGGGTTDLRAYVQNAVDYCIQNGRELFCPAGVYVINVAPTSGGTLLPVYLSNLTSDGQGLVITGEGRGKTIFREDDGATARGGRFTKMFYFYYGAGEAGFRVGSYTFRDITFDKNGGSNGAPSTLYEWEQAHIISWAGASSRTLDGVTFERCEFKNKVGACINFSSADVSVRSIVIRDVQSTDHPKTTQHGDGTFGQRGCIELGIASENTVIDQVTARYAQIEPVLASSPTRRRHTKINSSRIDSLEFTDKGGYSLLDVSNTDCNHKLLVRGVSANIDGCQFVPSDIFAEGVIRMRGCTIRCQYDAGANAVSGLIFGGVTGYLGYGELHVSDSSIVIDAETVAASPSGFGIAGNGSAPAGSRLIVVDNVNFDSRLYGSVFGYATADIRVERCKLAGHNRAIHVGGFSTNFGGDAYIGQNDFSAVTGEWVWITRSNVEWELTIEGSYPAADFKFNVNGVNDLDGAIKSLPRLYGSAPPSAGFWPRGQVVENRQPSAAGVMGWVCVTSGIPGTWKSFGAIAP